VALNCVANTRLLADGPFREVWVPPAAGDAGTAAGSALHLARTAGPAEPMAGADLGPVYPEADIAAALATFPVRAVRAGRLADEVAEALAGDQIVAWFQGAAEYGSRALGHRSILAHPGHPANRDRLNLLKGREKFRPIAPAVLVHRAGDVFGRGPLPSPYMVFVHDVAPQWRARIPAVTHVDATARVQTVDAAREPLFAAVIEAFAARTGIPVVANTSLNVAGGPIVGRPADALELLCSTRIDLLAIGPYLVRRDRA
jgi:carbamoyltransferase